MAKREYTVGVIGLGFGRSHISAFQAHGCRVVAVCQRDRAHAQEIAGKYGVEGVFERWEDLLEKARPEIVVQVEHEVDDRAAASIGTPFDTIRRGARENDASSPGRGARR